MSQAFYRKWRPQTWDEVVAQDHVVQTLRNAVRTGRTGHAYLMAGPRGTGKTTTARLLAKALNCLDPDPANRPCDHCEHCQSVDAGRFLDLIEIDAASNTSVDDVRDLREKINFSPTQGQYKVYIIDEVHMLSTAAFNALLKTLEEPPPHAIFILATTEVHKIPATILSRCQRYEFRRIPVPEIIKYLKKMAAEEHLEVDDDALQLIARQATGAMRDAVSLLDQLASTGNRVTLAEALVVLGTATNSMVLELIDAVLAKDPARGFQQIQAALDAGTDARQFARQVVDYLRSLLLIRTGNAGLVDATPELRAQMAKHAQSFDNSRLLEAIRLFNSAAVDTRASWHPGLALELALAESVEDKAAVEAAPAPQPARTPPPAQYAPQYTPEPAARSENPKPASPSSGAARPPESQAARPAEQPRQADSQPRQADSQPRQTNNQPRAADNPPAQNAPAGTPAATGTPAGAPAPAGGGKPLSQNDVQQNWNRVRAMVKKENSLTAAALNSCRTFGLKGDMLILGFVSEVVKSKMETPENIEILRKALLSIFGAQLSIRCIVVGNKNIQPADLDVDGDGMVGTALDLGGKIVYEE